jgi:predicted transcriptional regulator
MKARSKLMMALSDIISQRQLRQKDAAELFGVTQPRISNLLRGKIQPRSMYSLRHSAITFRLLYGQGIDLLTLARNARTSVEVINNHYASSVRGEQNIALLQSRRSKYRSTS